MGRKVVLVSVAPSLLLGVAYHDANGNGRYDAGEGVPGVSVTVDGSRYYTVTGANGGYALPLVSTAGTNLEGNAAIHFRGLPGEAERTRTITVGTATDHANRVEYLANVKLDAVAGAAAVAPTVAVTIESRWANLPCRRRQGRRDPAPHGHHRSLTAGDRQNQSQGFGGVRRGLRAAAPDHHHPGRAVKAKFKVRPLAPGTDPEAAVTLVLQLGGASGQSVIRITP